MSQHPIDEVFRRKLEDHSSEAPMHLWAQIDQRRNWKHKLFNQVRLRWFPLSAGALFVSFALIGLFNYPQEKTIVKQAFPIPLEEHKEFYISEKESPTVAEANFEFTPESKPLDPSLENEQLHQQIAPDNLFLPLSNNYEENEDLIAANQEEVPSAEPKPVHLAETPLANNVLLPLNFLDLPSPLLEVGQEDGLFRNDPECAKFSKGNIRIYTEILASPDFTFRQLDPKNPVHSGYAESREATESPEYNFSAGLRLSAVTGFGLALRTGVNYSQIGEKFQYVNGSEVITRTRDIFGPNGEVIGTDTIVEIGTRYKTTYNKYRTLDIPILAGYEFNYKKFVFAVNGGAYLNLIFDQKGDFLSPVDNQPVNFDSDNPNAFPAFKDKLGLGWYGSIGIHYRVKPRLQLMVEPHFKLYPKSFTQPNYVVDQKYFTTGIFFGIRHGI